MKDSVTVTEDPVLQSLGIAAWLRRQGFILFDEYGEFARSEAATAYGLVKWYPPKKPGRWLGIFPRPWSRRWVGTILFEDHRAGGTARWSGPWLLEVYGREELEPMRRLAEELAQEFKVQLSVELKSETTYPAGASPM